MRSAGGSGSERLAELDFEIGLAEAGLAGRLGGGHPAGDPGLAAARRDPEALRHPGSKYLFERPYRAGPRPAPRRGGLTRDVRDLSHR